MVTLLAVLLSAAVDPSLPPPAPSQGEPPAPPVSSFDQPEPDPDPGPRTRSPAPPARQPVAALRIRAAEAGAELAVSADGPGWSRSCPARVTPDRPCRIAPAPQGQIIDLRISGTRTLASKVFIGEGETTVVVAHQGYGLTVAGLLAAGVALVCLRAGVSAIESGDQSSGRSLITLGVGLEATAIIMILVDLGRTHNRVVVAP